MGARTSLASVSRRVVLIGASNLVLGLPEVMAAARCSWGGPLDVLAAIGHGRSYGHSSRVLWRELSGIVECGLWEALAARDPLPTAALVTDIGNDLLFGSDVDLIARWVDTCLRRLKPLADRIVVTALPMESAQRVGRWRFRLMRAILFPNSTLTWAAAFERAAALNERVQSIAEAHQVALAAPPGDWYGFDPIHIRRSQRGRAWRQILSLWQSDRESSSRRWSWRERWMIRRAAPEDRVMFGRRQRRVQPAASLFDGTMLSLY